MALVWLATLFQNLYLCVAHPQFLCLSLERTKSARNLDALSLQTQSAVWELEILSPLELRSSGMFYDANATLAPAFSYPGNCRGVYFYDNGTWISSTLSGYNVWTWVVAPFTNKEYYNSGFDSDGGDNYCGAIVLHGISYPPNITSVFSAGWPLKCPSPSHILGTFGLVNIAVALSSLILGNQKILYVLSCKLFGKEHEKPNFRQRLMQGVQLFLPLGLHLFANTIITILTTATPDYREGFTFGQLFLFLAARPRTTWIFALWAAGVASKEGTKIPGLESNEEQTGIDHRPVGPSEQVLAPGGCHETIHQNPANLPYKLQPGALGDDGTCARSQSSNFKRLVETLTIQETAKGSKRAGRRFFPYARFAKGQLLAEVVLLAMASYSIGSTAHFASRSGFYNLVGGVSENLYLTYGIEYESAAKMMYGGAIWWIICFPVAFLVMLSGFCLMCLTEDINLGISVLSFLVMPSLWLGQWLWLAGFVKLMGPLYCPPNLITQASIWISFSVVGVLFGAGFG